MRFLALAILAILAAGTLWADDPDNRFHAPVGTVQLLVKQLKAGLPHGWSVTYDGLDWIAINRDKEAMATGPAFNANPGEKPALTKLWFALRVVPFMTKETHRRLEVENNKIAAGLTVMANKYGITMMWGGDYAIAGRPPTDEDGEHIAAYNALNTKWKNLPGFYFNDITLEWGWQDPHRFGWPFSPVDKGVSDECEDVIKKIEATLQKY